MARRVYTATALAFLVVWLLYAYGRMGYSDRPTYSTPKTEQYDLPVALSSTPLPGAKATPVASSKAAEATPSDRPLITYAYAETKQARESLKLFISQGLHNAADFIFILNGKTDAAPLIPKKSNIKVVERPTSCFNLGAHGEVLRRDDLWKKYQRFITVNADARGPFLTGPASTCWSDAFLGRVTKDVKLVGLSASCTSKFHVQSTIWATDAVGMELLLYPPNATTTDAAPSGAKGMVAMGGCYTDMRMAIQGEMETTALINNANYKVDVMNTTLKDEGDCKKQPSIGATMHPYETIFAPVEWDIDTPLLQNLTELHSGRNYSGSWDLCR